MTASSHEKAVVVFRIVGVSLEQRDAFLNCLKDTPVTTHHRKKTNDYVVLVELSGQAVCDAVRQALTVCPLTAPYGVYVSLVTESDSDGLTLPPFVCDFWRAVGGSMDFSFTVV
jgi:hypothetical protein